MNQTIEVLNKEIRDMEEMVERLIECDAHMFEEDMRREINVLKEQRRKLLIAEEVKETVKSPGFKLAVLFHSVSIVGRLMMKKKGMVKSFWFGLPKKPGTYK